MAIRVFAGGALALSLSVIALAQVPPAAPGLSALHRNGFSAKATFFLKGDANIRYEERDHKVSAEHHKSAATSEYLKVEANPPGGATDKEFVHYYYECPPAPLTEQLVLSVQLKAYRAGAQVKARVVFPREKDPKNPDFALTTVLAGDTYDKVRQWQSMTLGDPLDTFKKHLPVLQARLGRAVDPTDAYIDRIILNVYAGPGVSEVWIDDLEVGPVKGDAPPLAKGDGAVGRLAKNPKAVPVEFGDGQILVDGDPFFMLAIRHTDTPLKTLRDAQFNTVWFPNDAAPATIEEAIRHGFWIVPTLPLPAGEWDAKRKPKRPDDKAIERDADLTAGYLRKFLSNDAVLMWHFGDGRTTEDLGRVVRAAEVVRSYDPRRPRSVDLWDGYGAYSKYVNAVGAHRWPLFSSLDLFAYKDWLEQRRALITPGKMMWTWIQTHLPEWYAAQLCGSADPAEFAEPVGPHPEQIRILTYLAIASGCRGLGYWSDKFLSKDTHHGKGRLLEIALLNSEVDILREVLAGATDPAVWVPTSDGRVPAAIVRGPKDILVVPIWLGDGTQYTPGISALAELKLTVPQVPEGSIAWRVTAAGVEQLPRTVRKPNGLEITVTEFDVACAIVITPDLGGTGKVARWQDNASFRSGETASRWAQLQAVEQYEKTCRTHAAILAAGGLEHEFTPELLAKSKDAMGKAREYFDNKQWDVAYRESRRALRPLRQLMRADWDRAVQSLDAPSASPFAVSFYSLPQHYALAAEVRSSRPAGNGFPHGGFELNAKAPAAGAAVDSLPGWKARKSILDAADGVAAIVNSDAAGVADPPLPPIILATDRNAPLRSFLPPPDVRRPSLCNHTLSLAIAPRTGVEKDGSPAAPTQALERAIVAVDSPAADFAPGALVRVSFWVKVPNGIYGAADGLVVFDSAGGEPLGVRTRFQPTWKQYNLYRRVPADGKISMTFALTGFGTAYIDDVKIEPMVGGGS